MSDLTVDQKIFLIEAYYTKGKSTTAACSAMHTKFGKANLPSDSSLKRAIYKWLEHATLDDRRESNPGPSYSVTTPETLDVIEAYFEKNPNASIRMAAAVLELNRETVCKFDA